MKKSAVVIISAVVIAALAACFYLYLYPQKPAVFEAIVPDSAIYYIATSNLNKKFRDFKNSTFFLTVSETSFYKNDVGPALDKIDSKAPFLKDFMDNDIALAVLSLGKPADITSAKKYDMESAGNILLLIRVDRNKMAQLKRKIGEAYAAQRRIGIVSKTYEGVQISTYKDASGKQALNYAIISDTILLSNSLADIQKSVSLFKNKSSQSLANNASFRKAVSRVKKDSLFWGYKSGKNYYAAFLAQLQEMTDPLQIMIMQQVKPLMSLMAALQDESFYVDYDKDEMAFVSKAYVMIDPSKDESGLIGLIARDKAIDQKAFSLIPRDAMAYYICNQDVLKCYDFGMSLLSKLTSNLPVKGPGVSITPDAMVRRAEYYLGIDLRKDLIALLGDDCGIVFAGLDEVAAPQSPNRSISLPQFYLFCGAKDTAKLGKVMEGVFRKTTENINKEAAQARERYKKAQKPSGAPDSPEAQAPQAEEKPVVSFAVENYADVDIYYLTFTDAPAPILEPNYCIVDKYLVFSLSRSLTKKTVQNYKTGSGSLVLNAQPAALKNDLQEGSSAVFFLDFQGMVNSLTRTSTFKKLRPTLVNNPKLGLSSADLDMLITALGTAHQFTVTVHKVPGEDVMESQSFLTIQE
jgi:hypothetical protein